MLFVHDIVSQRIIMVAFTKIEFKILWPIACTMKEYENNEKEPYNGKKNSKIVNSNLLNT